MQILIEILRRPSEVVVKGLHAEVTRDWRRLEDIVVSRNGNLRRSYLLISLRLETINFDYPSIDYFARKLTENPTLRKSRRSFVELQNA